MTGIDMDPACIHREARRQGERELVLRDADMALPRNVVRSLAAFALLRRGFGGALAD